MEASHNRAMSNIPRISLPAAALMLLSSAAVALEMTCTHPERPNHSFSVSGDEGIFTWDDHDIERVWLLRCDDERNALATCHRSENFGQRGASVMVFAMLPEGSLVESGYWALLDISRVSVTPGFVCTTSGD